MVFAAEQLLQNRGPAATAWSDQARLALLDTVSLDRGSLEARLHIGKLHLDRGRLTQAGHRVGEVDAQSREGPRPLSVLVASALLAAAASQQPPVFSAEIGLVRVEVSVTTKDGPLRSLGASAFELRDNGRPQRLQLVLEEEAPGKDGSRSCRTWSARPLSRCPVRHPLALRAELRAGRSRRAGLARARGEAEEGQGRRARAAGILAVTPRSANDVAGAQLRSFVAAGTSAYDVGMYSSADRDR